MPPPNPQVIVDAAWSTLAEVVTKGLGVQDELPISKICPPASLSDVVWKSEGRGAWTSIDHRQPRHDGSSIHRRTRTLATTTRAYVDIQHRMALSTDELRSLSVADGNDDLRTEIRDWANAAAEHHSAVTASFLAMAAGRVIDHPTYSLRRVLDDLAPTLAGRGRFRLVRLGAAVDKPPDFIASQVRLTFSRTALPWRALVMPMDRPGIVVERAFPLTLGWEPTSSGAVLTLDERFAHRVPPNADLALLTVIR